MAVVLDISYLDFYDFYDSFEPSLKSFARLSETLNEPRRRE